LLDLPAMIAKFNGGKVGPGDEIDAILHDGVVPAHEEGLLPTVLFQRVFISGGGGDHYVVFDPK
jgi:hypothetical protein